MSELFMIFYPVGIFIWFVINLYSFWVMQTESEMKKKFYETE